jgi:hypothetical protein
MYDIGYRQVQVQDVRPGLSDERTASEVTYSEAETVPLMFPSNGPSPISWTQGRVFGSCFE